MTKIAIDVRNNWLGGGIGQYVRRISAGLAQSYDVVGVSHRAEADGFGFPVVHSGLSQSLVESSLLGRIAPVSYERLVGLKGVDCLVFPNNTMPAFRTRAKTVAVIHDMMALRIRDFMVREGRGEMFFRKYEAKYRRVAELADVVCVVSEFTKRDVMDTFGVPEDRFAIVPPGVDYDTFAEADEARDAEVRTRLSLPENYMLYVGSPREYKNVHGLIRAFAALPESLRREWYLVISHGVAWLGGLVAELGVGDRVRFLGGVSEADKASVYRLAKVLGFVSYFEGFGMPALEAMAAGVPVLASNRASVPEVVGDAGLQVDPADGAAVAGGMERLMVDAELRAKLSAAGRGRAKAFTWRESARKMSAAIQKATKGGCVR